MKPQALFTSARPTEKQRLTPASKRVPQAARMNNPQARSASGFTPRESHARTQSSRATDADGGKRPNPP